MPPSSRRLSTKKKKPLGGGPRLPPYSTRCCPVNGRSCPGNSRILPWREPGIRCRLRCRTYTQPNKGVSHECSRESKPTHHCAGVSGLSGEWRVCLQPHGCAIDRSRSRRQHHGRVRVCGPGRDEQKPRGCSG